MDVKSRIWAVWTESMSRGKNEIWDRSDEGNGEVAHPPTYPTTSTNRPEIHNGTKKESHHLYSIQLSLTIWLRNQIPCTLREND